MAQAAAGEQKSSNETLQSINGALTTAKEAMQSLNEELQTVNAGLQPEVDDLTEVGNDLADLLNGTEIATHVLSADLELRRFTTGATKLFRFIPGDAGRPPSDVATELDCPQLGQDALERLRTLMFNEAVAGTHDGRWFRLLVLRNRTLESKIDGVVITFTAITAIKPLQTRLRGALTSPAGSRP